MAASHPVKALALDAVRFGWTLDAPLIDISSLAIARGEKVFLRGASGSGKSTLLALIAGIQTPWSGSIHVAGEEMTGRSGGGRDRIRANRMGVIFQMFNLLPYLSVVGNVVLATEFSADRRKRIDRAPEAEALRLLARLGLDDPALLKRKVRDLSVGQQQRVAAARALIGGPELVIADEPTSALDADTRDRFIELLLEEAARSDAAVLFVSHDAGLAGHFDRAIDMEDFRVREPAQ